ncbi:hypothetical protein SmJEL517_g01741 [Synchytrium microbalum]|uniref:tRNA (adenine(58)-N(1))-methyltransferase catalytic subunit TRM61 n=1 Tax=Synchytrium microbalum TaxID=1806994 RepID=A0A507CD03_9FUNG|nr:uncharacterized protein SmJEL517_g01741 [Synchytrium microbalum]TPX35926.1 hypothetical protein SmJEL517_g01741 [Synchytrium microbalum]
MASFNVYKKVIEYGDHVVMYTTPENMQLIKITEGSVYRNKYGDFKHSDVAGKRYGDKISSVNKRGFMTLLFPTPEMWTLSLPHRTQILYFADVAFISAYLELKPGVKMIESGTGSGSFSHSIARTIAPTGKLYTFEYHEERAERALREFEEHGLANGVKVECRDVCKNGFGMEDAVTAVFLDLPAPWEAIPAAKSAFKKNRIGRICCFSPNIEQVTRTVDELDSNGFREIKMFECLLRYHEMRQVGFKAIPAALPAPIPRNKISPYDLIEGTWDEVSEDAVLQFEASNPPIADDASKNQPTNDMEVDEVEETDTNKEDAVNGDGAQRPHANRRQKAVLLGEVAMSRPKRDMKSHTAYLTFGILPPRA